MADQTILILESDQDIARDLSGRLLALNYPLLPVVACERDALPAIQSGRPGLILLDLHFGGAPAGLHLAARIRQSWDLPVVLIIQADNPAGFNHAEIPETCGIIVAPFENTSIQASLSLASHFHQQEKSIRERQNQLAAILKSIGDGIITVNEQGVIQFINPVAVNITGLSETRALGSSLDSVLTIINMATGQQINTSDLIRNRRSTGPLFGLEVELLGPDGLHIPVKCSLAPLRDHLGNPNGTVLAFRSLSEIQRALEQSKAQAARSEALLRIIAQVNSQLNIDEMLASFLQESIRVLDVDAAVVFLADGEEGLLRIVAAHSLNARLSAQPGTGFELKPEQIEDLFPQNQSVVYFSNIQELARMPYHDFCLREDIRSLVLARLSHEDQNLGVLIIITSGRDHTYSREELQFIKGLTDYASVAIAKGRLFETLRASRSRLQMVTKRLVEVQEAERRAIARELHDQVGQVLTGLQFTLETGKRSAGEDLHSVFEDSQQLVTGLMQQIRELSLKLSPPMLDDMGLLRTLLWHFELYSTQTGIHVNFFQNGLDKRFPAEIEITAFRIIQEALTNVARYAKVDTVDVALDVDDGLLHLQVRDLGRGFDPQKTVERKTTFGLTSMKERAFLVGGRLTINTAPGSGTELLALLPISGFLERRQYDR